MHFLRQSQPKCRINMCPENYTIRLTPAKKYYINDLDQIKIKLEIVGEAKNSFLYKKVAIFDCTCLLERNKLCEACSTTNYI